MRAAAVSPPRPFCIWKQHALSRRKDSSDNYPPAAKRLSTKGEAGMRLDPQTGFYENPQPYQKQRTFT